MILSSSYWKKKKKVVKAWKMKAAIIEEYSTSIMI